MSQALIDKLRRARESTVEAGGHVFTVTRPTDAQAQQVGNLTGLELVHRFVTGWNLQEMDIIPGGNPVPVPFDAALWAEWVDDKPEVWGVLSDAILQAYTRYSQAREAAEKN